MNRIGLVTVVVRDYDEAIAGTSRARVRGARGHSRSTRSAGCGRPGDGHTMLLLAKATPQRSESETRPGAGVLPQTDDFDATHER